jgi:hypothetical protein
MSNATLKLDAGDFALRLIHEGTHLRSVGDNAPARDRSATCSSKMLSVQDLTLGAFGQPLPKGGKSSPSLQVVATDIVAQEGFRFPAEASLETALVVCQRRSYHELEAQIFLQLASLADDVEQEESAEGFASPGMRMLGALSDKVGGQRLYSLTNRASVATNPRIWRESLESYGRDGGQSLIKKGFSAVRTDDAAATEN